MSTTRLLNTAVASAKKRGLPWVESQLKDTESRDAADPGSTSALLTVILLAARSELLQEEQEDIQMSFNF